MKEDKEKAGNMVYISDLSVESFMSHFNLNKEQAERLLQVMADAGYVELLPMLTPKAEALINKLSPTQSGKRRDYLN